MLEEPTVSDRYRGRVDVSVGNFSVKLKNLQKSDSGVYTARIAELNKDRILPGYLVTVEDPVSPVKLTVDSVTNSSDPCDLTVTCRSLHSHHISISTTVTSNTTTCSQEGGERSKVTTSGASLHVYLKNYKIICNYSNHVSWTNDSLMIDQFCPRPPGPRIQTVRTGEDLLLEVDEARVAPEFTTLEWLLDKNGDTLVSFSSDKEPTVSDRYRGRVNVSVGSFSVTLKNLQKSDKSRGLTLVLVQTGEDLLLEVEEAHPVSPVKLTVDSVTNSSDPCDLTVTCRSLDSHQISISTTVTCNTTTCSQEGEEELKLQFLGATLHVYLLNDMIICNHSNLVSWTNDSIMVDPSLCVPPPGPESLSAGVSLCLVKTVVFSVALIIMVAAVINPVSPVKLTVDSVTNSSDPCDLTVTCRSLDSRQISISTTVTCNTTTCSQEGGGELKLQFFGATLHVYLLNGTIICHHRNLVSSTNDSIMVDPSLCVPPPGPESLSAGVSLCLVKTVVFSVALIIMVAAVISVHVMERLKR
ncbi:hypothetical protein INR49_009933, partial [Caranx melampygus]